MINSLLHLDHQIFYKINHLNHPWLEFIMPKITDLHRHYSFYLIYLLILAWSFFKQRRLFFGLIILVVVLAINDFIGGQLKDFFGRLRPDRAGLDVILRAPHFNGGSFPSNHTMNTFCLASFLGRVDSRLFLPLLLMASTVAFSRIYCGVHFPTDVLFGALLGSIIGKYSYHALQKGEVYFSK